jgi:hypothetical protein
LSSIVVALRSQVKLLTLTQAAIVATVVAALVFLLAYEGGSFALERRAPLAIVLWWSVIMAVALGLWPLARPPRAAVWVGALLAGYAGLTLASMAWSASAERAFTEFNRVSLYLAVFVVAVLAGTRANVRGWSDGFALGIAATGLLGLASRLLPSLVPGRDVGTLLPSAFARLAYPLGYWNGLAIFVALAFPLLLRIAVTSPRPLSRGGTVGVLPALAAVIYLASSRGGFVVAAVGCVAFVVLVDRRWTAGGAVAAGVAGAAASIAVLVAHPNIVNRPSSDVAAGEGWTTFLLIALACTGTGVVYALGHRLLADRLIAGRRLRLAVAAIAGAALIAAIAAADPVARFEAFKEPPRPPASAENDFVRAHLLTGSGSGRWQFWQAATAEFSDAPLRGHGAGSYEAWWAEHGTIPLFVRDAHSLYLEALAELGIGGLLIILTFALGFVVAVRRARRSQGPERALAAALAASFVAYAVGTGIDWMWELTVVSVVGMAILGLLTGPATLERARERAADRSNGPVRRRLPIVAVALASAWLLICAQAVPLLAQIKIGDSQEAARSGDRASALAEASAARRLEPWASTPYLQIALVMEGAGEPAAARAWIGDAIERDRDDWRLWLVAARIETKQGAIADARASLAEAKRLNPRSPLFQGRE